MSETTDCDDEPTSGTGHLLPVADAKLTWSTVWSLSGGHRLKFVAVALLGVASAAAGLAAPAVIGHLVDRVAEGTADGSTILWALLIMVVAAFVGALGAAATVVIASRSYQSMLAELREFLMTRSMQLPQSVVERAGTGDLISRSSDDVAQVADAAPQIIPAFTTAIFTIIVTFAGLAALEPWYGLVFVVVVAVYIPTVRWYLATGPRVYRAERAAMSKRAQQITESQRGHSAVIGLGLGDRRHTQVVTSSWGVVRYTLRARTVQNMFIGRLNIAEYLGMATILLIGFWLIGAQASTIGAVTAAMLLFLRLFGPISQLLIVIDILQSVLASLSRIVGVITMPIGADPGASAGAAGDTSQAAPGSGTHTSDGSHTSDAENAADPSPLVRLRGVSFSYDGERDALDHVDLSVAPAQTVAVVGASGAGKSTLAAVIAGIHEADVGEIRRPVRSAVVTQEVHVFAGTLRENLTLAAPDVGDEEALAALEAIGARRLPELLPDGLDTVVGARGHELTAAQTQQVALARIVLMDPELAILDEATAEAGSAQAGLLDQAAEAVLDGRSGLVIAHRLTQAADCDRIVVLEHGRIAEIGTHDELREVGGVYARLWHAWSRARA